MTNNNNNKNRKKTPIGYIPVDWEVKKIIDLAGNEKNNFNDGDWIEAEYITDNGIRLIQTGNIGNGIFIDKVVKKYVSFETFKTLKCKDVLIDDILICRLAAPAGRACIMKNINEVKMITAVDVTIFRPDESITNKIFLVNIFSTENWFKTINERCGGSTRTRISRSELGNIQIPLPPLPEQQKIAEIISTWDKAIENVAKTIEKLKIRNKGLAQILLSGKKRLKEFEKMEWKKEKANELFKNYTKKNCAEETLLSVTQDKGVIPRDMLEGRVTMPEGNRNSFKLVEQGDFVISLRSFQGGLEYSEYTGIVSPAYTVLKAAKKIIKEFYKYYFKSYYFIGHLAIAVIGIRDGKQISYDDFCTLKLPYPPLEEQKAISDILNTAAKELQLNEKKLEKLKLQKKGLMQKLLTGEVRVRIDEN